MADHTEAAPQLPPASVDFNALHDACVAGASHDEARESAVIEGTVALSADEAATRATASIADAPTLSGKNKAQLLEIAEAEGVTSARDADDNEIAIGEATNPQIIAAIEAKRSGAAGAA
jgi:hypothetical protein